MAVKTSELQKVTNLEAAGGSSFLVDTPQGTLLLPTSHFPQNFTADKLLMPDKTTTIEQRVRWHSGLNLVDNCDFAIWQRYPNGVFEGVPDRTYIPDRIKIQSSDGRIRNVLRRVNGGGILNESGPNCRLQYHREDAAKLNGQTITLSALVRKSTGEVALRTFTTVAKNFSAATDLFVANNFLFWLYTGEVIIRVKLEVGKYQTLAYQDADGQWNLIDPPPNPALEMLKCQRYYQLFETEALRPTNAQDFRPPMRINPVLGTIERDGKTYYTADANL